MHARKWQDSHWIPKLLLPSWEDTSENLPAPLSLEAASTVSQSVRDAGFVPILVVAPGTGAVHRDLREPPSEALPVSPYTAVHGLSTARLPTMFDAQDVLMMSVDTDSQIQRAHNFIASLHDIDVTQPRHIVFQGLFDTRPWTSIVRFRIGVNLHSQEVVLRIAETGGSVGLQTTDGKSYSSFREQNIVPEAEKARGCIVSTFSGTLVTTKDQLRTILNCVAYSSKRIHVSIVDEDYRQSSKKGLGMMGR